MDFLRYFSAFTVLHFIRLGTVIVYGRFFKQGDRDNRIGIDAIHSIQSLFGVIAIFFFFFYKF